MPDGVTVVPLATTTAVEGVGLALVHALGLAVLGQQEPMAVALEYLTARDLLLVFDTVEQLPGIGVLVQNLLAATPGIRVLVTTRDATVVPMQAVITMRGLRDASGSDDGTAGEALLAPAGDTQVATTSAGDTPLERRALGSPLTGAERGLLTPASDLYVLASGPAGSAWLPDVASLPTIRRICRLVQGYPLAIKMVASWAGFFGHEAIAARLTQQVSVQAGTGNAPADHTQTEGSPMQAVFGFLWSLLAERDRTCIGGLALFRGGFTAEAALDVAGVTPFLLAALGDRAFIQIDGAGRYHLHELLRQYAWSWLQGDTAASAMLRQRHAAWYAHLAAASAAAMRGPRFRQWMEQLEADLDNLRSALTWALDHAPLLALAAALDLTEFWLAGAYAREGHSWIDLALARAEDQADGPSPSLRLAAVGRLGRLERQCGDTDAARVHLTAAVALAEGARAGNERELAYSLSTLANIESDVGAHALAAEQARQALAVARRLDSPQAIAVTANMAVWPLIFAGALEEAMGVAVEGLQASRACGDDRSTANLTAAQATIAYYDPARHDDAIALYRQALDRYEALHDWSGLLLACNNLASVYLDDQQFALAAQSFADARRIGQRLKQHRMMANVLSGSGMVASIRGDDAAAWGFWREAMELALASGNIVILEESALGLAYVWARGGFTEQAAVLLGMIGLEPTGKPWLRLPIERARIAARPAIAAARWAALLAHGATLDVTTLTRMLLARAGPRDVPASLLPDAASSEPC